MNRQSVISICILSLIIISGMISGCKTEESSFNPTGPSTEVIPQPGDNVITVTGLLPQLTLDDFVKGSHAILIGEVVEILPAKWGTDARGDSTIYTDVIIQPERYLNGKAESGNVAIRVKGGRVGNDVVISFNDAVFYLGEKVLVFLVHLPDDQLSTVPESISPLNYYYVAGLLLGKWEYADGKATGPRGDNATVTQIENMIADIHGELPP